MRSSPGPALAAFLRRSLPCVALFLSGCAAHHPAIEPSGATLRSTASAPVDLQRRTRALLDQGRYFQAESTASLLIARSEARPASVSEAADAIDLLVEAMVGGGMFYEARALEAARRSLWLRERAPGPDSLDLARSVFGLGMLLGRRMEHDSAVVFLVRSLRIRERALGPEHADVAATWHELGWQRIGLAQHGAGDSLLRLANAIQARTSAIELEGYSESVPGLEIMAEMLGSRDTTLHQRAVALAERSLGADHPRLALRLIQYANVLRNLGRYAAAHRLLERALGIYQRALGRRNVLSARAMIWISVNQVWSGRLDLARPWSEQGLAITQDLLGADHPEMIKPLMNLGDLYNYVGDQAAARPLLERAIEIHERTRPAGNLMLALAMDRLAALYDGMGEHRRAKAMREKVLALRTKLLPAGHLDIGTAMDRLAQACDDEPARQRQLYADAAAIFDGAPPETHLAARGCWIRATLLGADRHHEAIALLERAIAIYERIRPAGLEIAFCLRNAAIAYQGTGRHTAATTALERSLEIFERNAGPQHMEVAIGSRLLGEQLATTGRFADAFGLALRAEKIRRDHLGRNMRVLPETQALLLVGSWTSRPTTGMNLILGLAAGPLRNHAEVRSAAWDAVIRSRALVLDEMGTRQRALALESDPQVRALAARYDSTCRRLSNLEVRGQGSLAPELHRARWEAAFQAREQAARALAERSVGFRREQERNRVGLSQVAAALGPGTGLVAFARHDPLRTNVSGPPIPSSYVAFVLRGGEETPRVVPLGAAAQVEAWIERWQREVQRGLSGRGAGPTEPAYRQLASRVRRALWDPVSERLAGLDQVLIVPEGPLYLVNFATLPAGTSSYLLEHGPTLHSLSAERDAVLAADAPPMGEGLLAMGAPDFDADRLPPVVSKVEAAERVSGTYRGPLSSCGNFHTARFGALPAARAELDEIASLWRESRAGDASPSSGETRAAAEVLSGARASETEFKTKAPGRRMLHLATHGFFLGDRCRSAAAGQRGIGGMITAGEAPATAAPVENPLRLSGLAFAGANRRQQAGADQDDGILTSEEIAAMDLTGVEWAVLSACETGVGEMQDGEGVLGLRRALQIAGVRTAIMSLWKVDDRAAQRWMRALYDARWRRGLDSARAVREASLSVLKEARASGRGGHPAEWGAFIAVGDWR
jgi:CHAT domain-containing protein/tetratricopeptide (TPR) repeat protein